MYAHPAFQLGWRHELWQYLRYYLNSSKSDKQAILSDQHSIFGNPGGEFLPPSTRELLQGYLKFRESALEEALELLRTEKQALDYCQSSDFKVGITSTQSTDHHQSSKALVSAASYTALKVAHSLGLEANVDPQGRCLWMEGGHLSVSPRRLDGAIPSLESPKVIWEVKEYWGKTKGGSKMSDAVYECQLVGMELRLFEEQTGKRVFHACLLDGLEQWTARKSDLARLIDLLNQGLIDVLIIGREVESQWEYVLRQVLE